MPPPPRISTEAVSPETVAPAARAATAAPVSPIPPPISYWVSPGLLSFIDHSPGMSGLRGLIRAELNVKLPTPTPATSEELKSFLMSNFARTRVYAEHMAGYYTNSRDGRPTSEVPSRYQNRRPGGEEVPGAPPTAVPRPANFLDPDGSLLLEGIEVRGRERGTAHYEADIVYTGNLRVPADTVTRGPEAIQDFIRSSVRELTENAENYVYGSREMPNDGWMPTAVNLTAVNYNQDRVAEAVNNGVRQP